MKVRTVTNIGDRERVPGPPRGWRPAKALTFREKMKIVIRQGGRDPDGSQLDVDAGIEYDHHPALHRRRWDPVGQDTIPAAGDLRYIVARNKNAHRHKTSKEDVPEIAKTRRLEGAKEKRAEKRMKGGKTWPTRKLR